MIMENQSRTKQGRRRIKNTEIKTDIFKVYKRKKKTHVCEHEQTTYNKLYISCVFEYLYSAIWEALFMSGSHDHE